MIVPSSMMEPKVIQILKNKYPEFEQTHEIPFFVRKCIETYLLCRTEKMGGHRYICPKCQHEEFGFNSCRLRGCPKCNEGNIKNWLNRTIPKLLPIDHYHVIFTVPEELNLVFLRNKISFTDIFFRTVNETLEIFLKDSKWLGAQVGKILTLHTWNSQLDVHPHIHCLISSGGLNDQNNFVQIDRDYLFPILAVSKVFRARFLFNFRRELSENKIELPVEIYTLGLKKYLAILFSKKWNVFICPRYSHGVGILKYLSKYVKGGCIKNSRIVSFDNSKVRIKIRDKFRQSKEELKANKTIELPIHEFIRRFLLHIHPSRQKIIRYYGLYSPNNRNKLKTCLNQEQIIQLEKALSLPKNPCKCPNCNTDMKFIRNYSHMELMLYFPERVEKLKERESG